MTDTLLDVRNVTHDFSLSKTACVRALDRLSFSIRRGEIYGLVGESGSGKSTAARCVMNLVQPQSGQIFYQGIDITNPRQFAANKKLLQTSRQIINLFRHLQAEHGFSFLFIAHDLSMVRYLCDRVGVLLRGRLVEEAPAAELFSRPQHPYTRALISAMPLPDPIRERNRKLITFDPETLPTEGALREVAPDHFVLTEGGGKA